MALFVDTSVWSLAFRRDSPPDVPEVLALRRALTDGVSIVTTGIVLLELLRGFVPQRAREVILRSFEVIELVEPTRSDYVEAATVATICRRAGVQLGTVDALLAQLTMSGGHVLLTTDRDFRMAAQHVDLLVWSPGRG